MRVKMWRNWIPHILLVGMWNAAAILEKSLTFLQTLSIELPYDPVTPVLGVYPTGMTTYIHINICTQMFVAASVMITKKYNKQPNCLPTD